jgi:pilus assembly protein FimV
MKVLAGLIMAWPLFANAQAPAMPATAAVASAPLRTITDEAFQQWIKEDNKVIQGILTTLTHIDTLVVDIERMLRQLPDFGTAPVAVKPAPAPAPVVIEKTVIKEVPAPAGSLDGWMPQLAGAALLALLAFWLGRKQGTTQGAGSVEKVSAPASPPKIKPVETPPPVEKRAAPPAPAAAAVPDIAAFEPSPAPAPAETAPPAVPPGAETPLEGIPSISLERPSLGQGDQALELAEIMLSMGLGHGATQTLTEQIRNEPKQALRHWLKLLDIYRKNGQQEEFERSAEELRLHFNVRPEDWHAQTGSTQSLESFPHIAKRLTELWGKPDCLVYMQNLLDDNRGGARSGFPQSVAEELLLLTSVMREAFGFVVSS